MAADTAHSKGDRLTALESVRGLAAIVVVAYHLILMFWVYAIQGSGMQHSRFEDDIFGAPWFSFLSGHLAVSVFFVLSGFVLSIGYFKSHSDQFIKSQMARRYLRLMLPALASCIIAYFLITFGLSQNQAVSQITQTFSLNAWSVTPSFFDALYSGTIGIFLNTYQDHVHFNPVLWTMFWEFFGSLLIFGFLLLLGKNPKRWVAYLLLIVMLHNTYFLGFIIGMAIADLYARQKLPKISLGLAVPVVLLGLYAGGVPREITVDNPFYGFVFQLSVFSPEDWIHLLRTTAATALILVVIMAPKVASLMEKKYLTRLGKYTFSLYLTHELIMFSATGWIFLGLFGAMSYNMAALASIALSVPLFVAATLAFERFVERPSTVAAKRFGNWFMAPQKEPLFETVRRKRFELALRLYVIEAEYRQSIRKPELV